MKKSTSKSNKKYSQLIFEELEGIAVCLEIGLKQCEIAYSYNVAQEVDRGEMSMTELCEWKKSGRNTVDTNFLSLPSGGFTSLKSKQQLAPFQGFLP
jgi:hypothetical protein